ncbi:MAG: hypothetical protein ACP5O1_11710 [Phycisphaerae bacterium]
MRPLRRAHPAENPAAFVHKCSHQHALLTLCTFTRRGRAYDRGAISASPKARLARTGLAERQMLREGVVENSVADMELNLTQLVVDGLEVGDQPLIGSTLWDTYGADNGNS